MRWLLLVALALILLCASAIAFRYRPNPLAQVHLRTAEERQLQDTPTAANSARVITSARKHRPATTFETNVGQFNSAVKFVARRRDASLFLTTHSVAVVLTHPLAGTPQLKSQKAASIPAPETSAVQLKFLGANQSPTVSGSQPLASRTNYYIGRKANWHVGVQSFEKVRYHDLYPETDVLFYSTERSCEYDYVVRPGGRPQSIRLGITGASSVKLRPTGDVVLKTKCGDVTLKRPIAYQNIAGLRTPIDAVFQVTRRSGYLTLSFKTGKYDHSRTLTIDPELVYSTYLGGSSKEFWPTAATGPNGDTVVVGSTLSVDFPTLDPIQSTKASSGNWDVFVTRFDPNGVVQYSTYLGGSSDDNPLYAGGSDSPALARSVALDAAGNASVTGSTGSSDFPVLNAYQSTLKGGNAFLARISPTGQLIFSTFFGGSNMDFPTGIGVDPSGYSTLVGYTWSKDFPVLGAYKNSLGTAARNGFVARFNPTGQLLFSTYLGGSYDDEAFAVALDSQGNELVTGVARSTDFPQVNAPETYHKGAGEVFVTSISPTGGINYSLLWGGSQYEFPTGITADSSGNALVCGCTESSDFPTFHAYQSQYGGGGQDAFLMSISPAGNPVFSTLLGGKGDDLAYSVAVDSSGNVVVGGTTGSGNLPLKNAAQPKNLGDSFTGFVARYTSTGTLMFCTYLGGSNNTRVRCVVADQDGNSAIVGETTSGDFPLVSPIEQWPNVWQTHGFVSRYSPNGSLLFSSYLGGSGTDYAICVNADATGCLTVVGQTSSPEFPIANAAQSKIGGADDAFVCRLAFSSYLKALTFSPPSVAQVGATSTATVTTSGTFKSVSLTFDATQFVSHVQPIPLTISKSGTWDTSVNSGFLTKALVNPITVTAVGTRADGTTSQVSAPFGFGTETDLDGNTVLPLSAINPYTKKPQKVDGVACDNNAVLDTKTDVTTTLSLGSGSLPALTYATAFVSYRPNDNQQSSASEGSVTLNPPPGSAGPLQSITYTPPLEFNRNQSPTTIGQVDLAPTRNVYVTIRGYVNGKLVVIRDRKITLVRPLVFLVHGINSTSDDWRNSDNPEHPWCQQPQRFPYVAMNHGSILNGNGPVELGARLLKTSIDLNLISLWNGTFSVSLPKRIGVPLGPSGLAAFDFQDYLGLSIASNRVDIVAWSYGGLIARWYMASNDSSSSTLIHNGQFGWYVPYPGSGYATPQRGWFDTNRDGFNPDWIQADTLHYGADVRKLITLGSMWRGVPMANYANEANLTTGFSSLQDAAFIGGLYLGSWLDTLSEGNNLTPYGLMTKAPSMQVMGVESKWQQSLGFALQNENGPFHSSILYGSVSGDNSQYLTWIATLFRIHANQPGIYGLIDYEQQGPSLFPYLGLECRLDLTSGEDFSDGIVPLWSSEIPGAHFFAHCAHDMYPFDPDARTYVFCSLNHRGMSAANASTSVGLVSGGVLNKIWDNPSSLSEVPNSLTSADKQKTWQFVYGMMAPQPENTLYVAGRIRDSGKGSLIRDRTKATASCMLGLVSVNWSTEYPCDVFTYIVTETRFNGSTKTYSGNLSSKPSTSHSASIVVDNVLGSSYAIEIHSKNSGTLTALDFENHATTSLSPKR